MSRAAEIYPLRRVIESELHHIIEDKRNGEIIRKYYQARVAEGLSLARIEKCINTLKQLSRLFGKPFITATKEDIVELVAKIEQKDCTDWTKYDYKVILKKFYQWLRNCEYKEYPTEVKWIRPKKVRGSNVKRNDLLSSADVFRMADKANNIRDKALILVLFDSGSRIGEILTLRIDEVEFNQDFARLYTDGKTGKWSSVISWSVPALATWLENHPLKDNPRAPLWVRLDRKSPEQLQYQSARMMIKECAQKAGIIKRVHAHLFKHSLATPASTKLSHEEMCMKFHWIPGSSMPATYVHLVGDDLKDIQAKLSGQPIAENNGMELPKLAICTRCSSRNTSGSKFCSKCGLILDSETAIKLEKTRARMDALLNRLTEDPSKLEKLLAMIED